MKTAREKQIDSKALALPDRLRKKKTTGKNEEETVEVEISGGREINSIEINYRKLKITKKDADLVSEEIKKAINDGLLKYQKTVEREIEKI